MPIKDPSSYSGTLISSSRSKIKTCFVSVDVEQDLGGNSFRGVESLDKILSIFEKYDIPATLFVTGETLRERPEQFQKLANSYEIACHGFTHRFWNTLSAQERQKELEDFINLYRQTFQKDPRGFRAPSHVIDKAGIELLDEKGFLYDSSIVPHYPPFKKYRGYKGKAPLLPYRFEGMNILEIPVRGQFSGIPLAGAWIRSLPIWIYQTLFSVSRPEFVTLNMHSWDIFDPRFLEKLPLIIEILKNNQYQFSNGEKISENRR